MNETGGAFVLLQMKLASNDDAAQTCARWNVCAAAFLPTISIEFGNRLLVVVLNATRPSLENSLSLNA